jgi:adenylate cyclase
MRRKAMAHVEIERRFLVANESWHGQGEVTLIRQGYLSTDPDRVVRARIAGAHATLTVKGRSRGAVRTEVEFAIPLGDAEALLALAAGSLIEKRRHRILHGGFAWELDEYLGDNAGLLVAELEVPAEEEFARALASAPPWLGREVTEDGRLANAALAGRPFASWSEPERSEIYGATSLMVRG